MAIQSTLVMDLKTIRAKRGLTQAELSKQSGIPQMTISKMERGEVQRPSWYAVARLAKALDVKPENLFPIEMAS